MWDAAKRKRTLVLGGFLNSVIGVGASPTDSLFATGGGDNVVCIWKYNAGSATGATASAGDIKDEVCTCNCRTHNSRARNCSTWCMFCHLGRACCYSKNHGCAIDSNQRFVVLHSAYCELATLLHIPLSAYMRLHHVSRLFALTAYLLTMHCDVYCLVLSQQGSARWSGPIDSVRNSASNSASITSSPSRRNNTSGDSSSSSTAQQQQQQQQQSKGHRGAAERSISVSSNTDQPHDSSTDHYMDVSTTAAATTGSSTAKNTGDQSPLNSSSSSSSKRRSNAEQSESKRQKHTGDSAAAASVTDLTEEQQPQQQKQQQQQQVKASKGKKAKGSSKSSSKKEKDEFGHSVSESSGSSDED
jgi:hypothetical protein